MNKDASSSTKIGEEKRSLLGFKRRVERNAPRSKDTWHNVQIGSRKSLEKNTLAKQIEHPTPSSRNVF